MSSIIRAALEVVTARDQQIHAANDRHHRNENQADARLEIALENLDHAMRGVHINDYPYATIDLDQIEQHWSTALDTKCSKDHDHDVLQDALIDSACDVPILLDEITRLTAELAEWEAGR